MVRTKPDGLKRGRALYRGKDAYASQTFENDQRAQYLTGLLSVFGAQEVILSPSAYNTIAFLDTRSKEVESPVMRHFSRVTGNAGKFICQRDFTSEVSGGVRIDSVDNSAFVDARLIIIRGSVIFLFVASTTNLTGSTATVELIFAPKVFDIKRGDVIYMEIDPGASAAARIRGATLTPTLQTIHNTSILIKELR